MGSFVRSSYVPPLLRKYAGAAAPNIISLDTDILPAPMQFVRSGVLSAPTSINQQVWTTVGADTWVRCSDGANLFVPSLRPYQNLVQHSRNAVIGDARWPATGFANNTTTAGQPSPDGTNGAVRHVCTINQFPIYQLIGGAPIDPGNFYQITVKDGPAGTGIALSLQGYGDAPFALTGLSKASWSTFSFIDPWGSTRTGAHQEYFELITGETYPGAGVVAGPRDVYFDFPLFIVGQKYGVTMPWTNETGQGGTSYRILNQELVDSAGYVDNEIEHLSMQMSSANLPSTWNGNIISWTANDYVRLRGSDLKVEIVLGGVQRLVTPALAWNAGDDMAPRVVVSSAGLKVRVFGVTYTATAQPALNLATLPTLCRLLSSIGDVDQFPGGMRGNIVARASAGAHWRIAIPNAEWIGDSLTQGLNGPAGYEPPTLLANALVPAKLSAVINAGIGGDRVVDMLARADGVLAANNVVGRLDLWMVWGGRNSLTSGVNNDGAPPAYTKQQIMDQLITLLNKGKARSMRTAIITLLPGLSTGDSPDYEADRQQINAMILAQIGPLVDVVIRADLINGIGLPGQNTSPYYNVDASGFGTHLNGFGEQMLVGDPNSLPPGVTTPSPYSVLQTLKRTFSWLA